MQFDNLMQLDNYRILMYIDKVFEDDIIENDKMIFSTKYIQDGKTGFEVELYKQDELTEKISGLVCVGECQSLINVGTEQYENGHIAFSTSWTNIIRNDDIAIMEEIDR